MPGDIIILHLWTKNYDQMMYSSWDMVRNGWTDAEMDRQTDGRKKWYIEVGAPPKNQIVNKLISFQKILKELIRKNIYTLLKQVIFAIVFLKVNVIHKITALSTLNC